MSDESHKQDTLTEIINRSRQDVQLSGAKRHAETIAIICWEKRLLGETGMEFERVSPIEEEHEIMRAVLELNRKTFVPVFNIKVTKMQGLGRLFTISWTPVPVSDM